MTSSTKLSFLIIRLVSLMFFIILCFEYSLIAQCPGPNCYNALDCVGLPDKDNDGIPDAYDYDKDNDGIPNAQEGTPDCTYTTNMTYKLASQDYDEGAYSNGDSVIRSFLFELTSSGDFPASDVDSIVLFIQIPSANLTDVVVINNSSLNINYTYNAGTFDDTDPSWLNNNFCNNTIEFLGATVYLRNGLFQVPISAETIGICNNGTIPFPIASRTFTDCDTDMDGIPNCSDLDSDNDGIPDAIEACGDINLILEDCSLDWNGDAIYPDNNGDSCPDGFVSTACSTDPIDTDNDGIPDFLDLNSDGDGCSDATEAGNVDINGTNDSIISDNYDEPAAAVNECGLLMNNGVLVCNAPENNNWIDGLASSACCSTHCLGATVTRNE